MPVAPLVLALALAPPPLENPIRTPNVVWTDVTSVPLRGRHLSSSVADAFVRRAPSATVRLVHLAPLEATLRGRHLEANEAEDYSYRFDGERMAIVDGALLELPLCTGGSAEFRLRKNSVLLPDELLADFPRVRAYHGREEKRVADGVPPHVADVTVTPQGIRAQISMAGGRCYIDPHTHGRTDLYTVYSDADALQPGDPAHPARRPPPVRLPRADESEASAARPGLTGRRVRSLSARAPSAVANDERRKLSVDPIFTPVVPPAGKATKRTLRMAVACSHEWVFGMVSTDGSVLWRGHSGCPPCWANTPGSNAACDAAKCEEAAMAGLATTMARAGGVWRRANGLDLSLIAKQGSLLKYKKGELPNNNNDDFMTYGEWYIRYYEGRGPGGGNEPTGVELSDFDLGHTFSIGDGGGMGGGFPCVIRGDYLSGIGYHKANGATASEYPKGDSFDINYVAHELGHQFNLMHTWTGKLVGCTKGQFATSFDPTSQAAMELGAGNTLETYAGICGEDDIIPMSDPYFHVFSLHEFETNFFQNPNPAYDFSSCGTTTTTTNDRPTVTAPADCAVPRRTPFVLSGSAVDPNGQTLKYNWEQVDPSPVRETLSVENYRGPLFVSVRPTAAGHTRQFPKMAKAVTLGADPTPDPHERLSSYARTLHFALTARDEFALDGGAGVDDNVGTWHTGITAVSVAPIGPLVLISPKAGDTITAGALSVTFALNNAAGKTDAASVAIKAASYKAEMSADDGATWTSISTTGATPSAAGVGSVSAVVPASVVGQQIYLRVVSSTTAVSGQKPCDFWAPSNAKLAVVAAPPTTLSSSSPAHAATDVNVGVASALLEYSGPILKSYGASAGDPSYAVKVDGVAVAPALSDQARSVLIVPLPDSPLGTSTTYSISVDAGYLTDALGVDVAAATVSFTTAAAPPPSPPTMTLVSYSPADQTPDPSWGAAWLSSTKIDPSSSATSGLTLTFSGPVRLASTVQPTDLVVIEWIQDPNDPSGAYSSFCDIALTDSTSVSPHGSTLLINPFSGCRLNRGGQYRLSLPAGVVEDAGTGAVFAGIPTSGAYHFNTVIDETKPAILSTTPADGATAVSEHEPFIMRFNDDFVWASTDASKKITFEGYYKGALVDTVSIALNDEAQVDVWTEDMEIEVWPTYAWYSDTVYRVSMDAGAVEDASYNGNDAFTQAYTFTTTNTIEPLLKSVVAEVGVGNAITLTLTFTSHGPVSAGIGKVSLLDETNATATAVPVNKASVVTFPAMTETAVVTGNDYQVVVQPGQALAGPMTYAVRWPAGAFKDSWSNGVLASKTNEHSFSVSGALAACVVGSTWSATGLAPCANCTATCANGVREPCHVTSDAACNPLSTIAASWRADGVVTDYDASRRGAVASAISTATGIATSAIHVDVMAGSVIISATVEAADAAAAKAAAYAIGEKLGTAAQATEAFVVTVTTPPTVRDPTGSVDLTSELASGIAAGAPAPDADADTPPADPKADPCFPGDATAVRESGAAARLDELKAGDRVRAADAAGGLYYDEVSRFSYADYAKDATFVTLVTATASLRLTAEHRVPVGATCCSNLKKAKDVAVGETLWVAAAGAAKPAVVTKVGAATGVGVHNPLMKHGGYPLVDGVVTAFESVGVVKLASHTVPLAEALCEATGTCAAVHEVIALAHGLGARPFIDGVVGGTGLGLLVASGFLAAAAAAGVRRVSKAASLGAPPRLSF